MNNINLLIIHLLLFTPTSVFSGWTDLEGKSCKDTPDRKSIGKNGTWLILPDNEKDVFSRWDTPSDIFHVKSTNSIERGKILSVLVFFIGCGADKDNKCNLVVKYRIIRPDGKIYAEIPYQEAWVGKPAPINNTIGLSMGYIQIIIDPGDPLGKYTVHATVYDNNLKSTYALETNFVALESKSINNKLPQPKR